MLFKYNPDFIYSHDNNIYRSDPDKDTQGWGENDRGVSFTFGADVVAKVNKIILSFKIRFNFSL